MKSALIGLLAETSLHPGSGQTAGVIDLPVAREAATGYPVIVGSSLKGALRERAEQLWGRDNEKVYEAFGRQENAGAVAVTDARLLLLPVRCLSGHYKWVTCPYLLERYCRDGELAAVPITMPALPPHPEPGQALAAGEGRLFLEELSFDIVTTDMSELAGAIAPLIPHQAVRERLSGSLVVISDDEFAYFARYGLAVNARNVLNDDTKTSENLWYEETLPPDSLFYALLLARAGKEGALVSLAGIFKERPYLQVGANETVGQGWCAVSWLTAGGEGE
ncbi:MAG: type III-B CRISPR module RAMP protein Cmr4 [Thermoanaerobacteraceae bacterium]|nr:type III-B CRISPR module RAMP protein Cmr4 [Thermoanaerobacteraceae bacterium]